MTAHNDYIAKYLDNSEISRNEISDLKRNLILREAIYSQTVNKAKAGIISSYKITQILDKDEEITL
jgi:hypothetical protein